eukprot:TRINITY_DN8750_c0_g1_i1.p1 TRINITY_DN8750_c0_g1~~TRINITY_DN8750_c0_g1_i1.p1  ORF type:complete len:347 (-),score=45.91 TRINITY_DN8750_c0_g1_i1:106-1026(-)
MENIGIAITAFKDDGLGINVDSRGIVDSNAKTILGLFWQMIKHYQLGSGVAARGFGSGDTESDLQNLERELERLNEGGSLFLRRGETNDTEGSSNPLDDEEDPIVLDPCHKCEKSLNDGGVIVSVEGMHKYHSACFVCTNCNAHFESNYWKHNSEPYCFEHFLAVAGKKCASCNELIKDADVVSAEGKDWHNACFVCTTCHNPFITGYHMHQSKPYCRHDYYRVRGWLCGRCEQLVEKTDRKALGKSWHTKCFKCMKCGNEFGSDGFFDVHGQPHCVNCQEDDDTSKGGAAGGDEKHHHRSSHGKH